MQLYASQLYDNLADINIITIDSACLGRVLILQTINALRYKRLPYYINNIVDRMSMLDGGTNCSKGEQLWQLYMVREAIGGTVFGPVGPLAVQTTYGVTGLVRLHSLLYISSVHASVLFSANLYSHNSFSFNACFSCNFKVPVVLRSSVILDWASFSSSFSSFSPLFHSHKLPRLPLISP